MPRAPQSGVLAKSLRNMWRNFGEIVRCFSSFNFQDNGRKQIHRKSSTFSTVHQTTSSLLRLCGLGRPSFTKATDFLLKFSALRAGIRKRVPKQSLQYRSLRYSVLSIVDTIQILKNVAADDNLDVQERVFERGEGVPEQGP